MTRDDAFMIVFNAYCKKGIHWPLKPDFTEDARDGMCEDIAAAFRELQDKVISGPPLAPEELLKRLEKRLGSLKLNGERDDLLLDAAVFVKTFIEHPELLKK